MKTKRFLFTAGIALATAFTFSCSSDDSKDDGGGGESSSSQGYSPPPPSSSSTPYVPPSYCDYGPITEYGGGCFEITEEYPCNAEWGQVVSVCPPLISSSSRPSSSSSAPPPSSSSIPPPSSSSAPPPPSSSSVVLPPNALEVTLTAYKELSTLDPTGYGDPRISFRIRAYSEGVLLNDATTKLLLNRDDIYEWNGTAKDTVTIHTLADSTVVNPIVKDADVSSDDDYSPPGAYVTKFTNGSAYNNVERKNDNVSVTFNLRFFRR